MAGDPVEIIGRLLKEYPRGAYPGRSSKTPPLWREEPFHVLIATVLSQRTRDENTRAAADGLFSRYDTPSGMASADPAEVEMLIRPAGFPKAKARAVIEIARIVHEEYGDRVPTDIDALLRMPMVGRKTANCLLAYGFGIDAICVDTHVHRISNRLGLVETNCPDATEDALKGVVPKDMWRDVNKVMVRHGQLVCLPRRPRCQDCVLRDLCDYFASLDVQRGGAAPTR